MDAEELVAEYLEDGLPQEVWRDRLEFECVGSDGRFEVNEVDEVLEEAYDHANEYHAWVDGEIDEYGGGVGDGGGGSDVDYDYDAADVGICSGSSVFKVVVLAGVLGVGFFAIRWAVRRRWS